MSASLVPAKSGQFQYSLRTLLLVFVVLASSMGVFGAWGIVVFALTVGLALYLRYGESLKGLAYLVLAAVLLALLWGISPVIESSQRTACRNNLKQVALAVLNYEHANGHFPPPYIADKSGKPLCSWRVLILPYMEADPLLSSYDLAELWDGPKNKKLLASRPWTFVCPSDPNARAPGAITTSYVAVIGPKTVWGSDRPGKSGTVDLVGETGNDIMLVEVADSGIAWTEPRDLTLADLAEAASHGPHKDFFFIYDRPGIHVAMTDGSVSYMAASGQHFNWPNIAALAVWVLSVGLLLTHAVRTRRREAVP